MGPLEVYNKSVQWHKIVAIELHNNATGEVRAAHKCIVDTNIIPNLHFGLISLVGEGFFSFIGTCFGLGDLLGGTGKVAYRGKGLLALNGHSFMWFLPLLPRV